MPVLLDKPQTQASPYLPHPGLIRLHSQHPPSINPACLGLAPTSGMGTSRLVPDGARMARRVSPRMTRIGQGPWAQSDLRMRVPIPLSKEGKIQSLRTVNLTQTPHWLGKKTKAFLDQEPKGQ